MEVSLNGCEPQTLTSNSHSKGGLDFVKTCFQYLCVVVFLKLFVMKHIFIFYCIKFIIHFDICTSIY